MQERHTHPSCLIGQVSDEDCSFWLTCKAQTHARRDRRRGNDKATAARYQEDIHGAVKRSGGRDAYTGEDLDWSLLSQYDNEESKAGRGGCSTGFALLPTVDHASDEDGPLRFKICAWRTNDAKSDLSLSEFLILCRRVLGHHGYAVTGPNMTQGEGENHG